MSETSLWNDERLELQETVDDVIDSNAEEITDNAEANPALLLLLSQADRDRITGDMILATDSVLEKTVEHMDAGPSEVPDSIISTAYAVGSYFTIQAIQRGFHRIHSAVVARQIDPSERPDEIDRAVARAKTDAYGVSGNELGQSYNDFFTSQAQAKGITRYEWIHSQAENFRPHHRARDGAIFNVGEPSGDEPGMAYNCGCFSRAIQSGTQAMKNPLFALARTGDRLILDIRGAITDDKFDDEDQAVVGVNNLISEIESQSGFNQIFLKIWSRGGQADAGLALHSYLSDLGVDVTASIYGVAASAASVIPMCCSHVDMGPADLFNIHNPFGLAFGDYSELGQAAAAAEAMRNAYAQAYMDKTGMELDEIKDLMDADTVMSAQEAFDYGFIDEIRTVDLQANSDDVCVGDFCAPSAFFEKYTAEQRKFIGRERNLEALQTFDKQSMSANAKPSDKLNMNLTEAKKRIEELEAEIGPLNAKLEISATFKKDAEEKIAELESQQLSETGRAALRAEMVEQIEAENADAEQARSEAQKLGFKAEGKTGTEIRRAVCVEGGMSAENAAKYEGEMLEPIYQYALKQRTQSDSDKSDLELAANQNPSGDLGNNKPSAPFSGLKKAGIK